jgi:hypothetical protein
MKTMLLAFCLVAAARLCARDGVLGTIPPKINGATQPEAAAIALATEPKPSMEDAGFFSKLLSAIEAKDYGAFVADGEPAFKALPRENFNFVAAQLASALSVDHAVTYLGALKQRGYRMTLWKVSFSNGSDDMLATLSVRNGKVGGFFIK